MHFIGNFSDIRLRLVAQHVANYCQASLVRITEHRARMCGALWLEAIVVVNGKGHSTTTAQHWEDQRWSVHQEAMHDNPPLASAAMKRSRVQSRIVEIITRNAHRLVPVTPSSPSSKALAAKVLRDEGVSYRAIGKALGVSSTQAYRLVNGGGQ